MNHRRCCENDNGTRAGSGGAGAAAREGGVEAAGEAGERRRFEQRRERQLDAERAARAHHDARRQQRVSAQREEVVVPADRVHAEQQLPPDLGEARLDRRRGRGKRRRLPDLVAFGLRQRRAIDLAGGRAAAADPAARRDGAASPAAGATSDAPADRPRRSAGATT